MLPKHPQCVHFDCFQEQTTTDNEIHMNGIMLQSRKMNIYLLKYTVSEIPKYKRIGFFSLFIYF